MSGECTPDKLSEKIAKALNHFGLADPGADALRRLAIHLSLLYAWNERFNLTAIVGVEASIRRHVVESLEALPALGLGPEDFLVDLGAGAGYPGLALLSAADKGRGLLVEARDARAAFLRAAVRDTGLDRRVEVHQTRLLDPRDIPAPATIVTLRAFTAPGRWIAGALERPQVRLVAAWLGAADAAAIRDALRAQDRGVAVHPLRAHPTGVLLIAAPR